MDVLSQHAYLIRVKHLLHNSHTFVALTLVDVHSGDEILLSESNLPLIVDELIKQLGLAVPSSAAPPAHALLGHRFRLRTRKYRCAGVMPGRSYIDKSG
jgi:hypothetical protein